MGIKCKVESLRWLCEGKPRLDVKLAAAVTSKVSPELSRGSRTTDAEQPNLLRSNALEWAAVWSRSKSGAQSNALLMRFTTRRSKFGQFVLEACNFFDLGWYQSTTESTRLKGAVPGYAKRGMTSFRP